MLVIYTETYLSKLWTCYEIASFLAVHDVSALRVVPTIFPLTVYFGMFLIYAIWCVDIMIAITVGVYHVSDIVNVLFMYFWAMVIRKWARQRCDVRMRLSAFDVRDCTCFCEDDRPLVYANIKVLITEHLQRGQATCSLEEDLHKFNELVRERLFHSVMKSLGHLPFPYKSLLPLIMCYSIPRVVDVLGGFSHGMSARYCVIYCLWYATVWAACFPVIVNIGAVCISVCLDLTGWREHAWLFLNSIFVIGLITAARVGADIMEAWALDSDVGLALFCCCSAVCCVVTYVIFSYDISKVVNAGYMTSRV